MLKSKKGFTLIELIVVIVIIGILALVVVNKFIGPKEETKITTVTEADIGLVCEALAQYKIDYASFPVQNDIDWGTLRPLLKDSVGNWYIETLPEVDTVDATASINFTDLNYTGDDSTFTIIGKARDKSMRTFTTTPEKFSWE
ncbi:prepilin-type N-terminal cleavage/methylation domain-containing protein [candidate division WOR-3 bacterium]|nr:prepilin-type N-terminal cleavage/methylation domain-containing protein [candidate division WOR-3 bacterium]